MGGQIEHVFRHPPPGNVVEVILLVAHLVRIAKRYSHDTLATRFERDHVLARGEHDAPERDYACVLDRVPDYGVGLGARLAVRDDVIRIGEIELVDLLARHDSSISITCLLSIATASSSSGSTGTQSTVLFS